MYFTETRRDGNYLSGDILFTSETNNVDVRFSSDFRETRTGFTLDVRSIPCSDRANFQQLDEESSMNPGDTANGDCGDRQVVVAAGKELRDALIINRTEKDIDYWKDPCRDWTITTDENQVNLLFLTLREHQ